MFRATMGTIVAVVLGISIHHRRKARRAGPQIPRRAEEPWLVVARLAVGLPIWLAVLLYVAWPRAVAWAQIEVPPALRWAAAVAAAAMIPLSLWIFRSLGSNVSETALTKEGQSLVTGGPYRWVRHPLYSASTVWLAALGVLAANAFMVLMTLLAAGFLPALVKREEAALLERFGSSYREYMARTGRLVPRIASRSSARTA